MTFLGRLAWNRCPGVQVPDSGRGARGGPQRGGDPGSLKGAPSVGATQSSLTSASARLSARTRRRHAQVPQVRQGGVLRAVSHRGLLCACVAERVTSLGKDWHRPCLKCEKCGKTLTSGGHSEHEGKPYCNHPCYSATFGPKGFGRGGAESHTFK
nr:muscle LIM protein Mlp84B isoform X1 [Manis javanica]